MEPCRKRHRSVDAKLTLTLDVTRALNEQRMKHDTRDVPVDGCEPFEVDGEDVGCVDVMNAAFCFHQVRALLARVLVVALETLDARERLVQERERVLCKVHETND